MCVVSMIGDHFNEKWEPYRNFNNGNQVSKFEFDKLKAEVEEMKRLLRKAKIYDVEHNEPNCEIEEKMEFLKKVAKLVGIDLDDVIKKDDK